VQIIRANLSASDPAALRAEMGPGAADIARIVPEVRQLLPDLPEPPPLDPDQERFRLFDSVTRYLTALAAAQPLLLVLDDLHWADRSSLLLLEFLAEEVARARICLLGTYRDADVDRHHPLSRTLAQLSRSPATQRVDLAGLGIEDVARYSALAAGSAPPRGLAAAIWEQTEGNPFFMGEVVRLLRDEGRLEQAEEVRSWRLTIPPGVRETVGLRLDRLSAEANQALTIAAITGREFALSVLERASDLPQARVLAALEEALAAGIIDEVQDAPGRFRFSHLLIRQTLYEEVSNARRVYVHRQIGEALERVHAANLEPVLAELAYHFNLAAPLGDVGRAIEYATLAGAQAMDRVAWADAVGHYERALGLLQAHAPAEERRRCELLLSLGEAQKNAGDTVEARETFERAAGIARSIEAPEHFARAALGIAEAGFYSEFWYEDLARPLDEARAMLGREPSPLRVRLLSRLAHMLGDSPDSLDRRRALCEEAVEIARMIDDPGVLAYALYARVVALATPENLDERIADASEIIRLAEAAGDQQLALLGHAWQVFDHLEVGDLPAVDEEIEAYARAANALRQPQTEWGLRVRRTMRLLMEGQFDEAERLAHEALVLGRQSMAWPATAAHVLQLFVIRREQGRLPEIEAAISGLVREYPGIPSWRCLLAELYAETGRDADARSAFEQLAQRDFGDIPRDIYWLANMAILAEVCATLEDERWAALLYHMLLPFAGRIISPGTNAICLGPTDFYLGILATTLRDWDAVDAHLAAATRQSDQLGMRPALARAQYAHAAMFATRGAADDLLQAAAFASAAREIAAELQMVQVAAQVDRLIGRIESAEM
jgi:tetratricopeptide (TPR) repeat protein